MGVYHGPSRVTKLSFNQPVIKQTEGRYRDGKRIGTFKKTKFFIDGERAPIEKIYEVMEDGRLLEVKL